VRTGPRASS